MRFFKKKLKNSFLSNFIKKPNVLMRGIQVEMQAQHAGTVLGLAWIVIGPFILLTLYAIIYSLIFKLRTTGLTLPEYILNMFSGLVLFVAFSQGLSSGSSSLNKNQKLIFSNFPTEFIPSQSVAVAYTVLIPSTIFVIIGDLLISKPSFHLLFVPLIAFLQFMFSLGIGFLLALVGLVIKDIEFIIQYITTALIVVTPIAYTPEMIPNQLVPLLGLNPLYYFVTGSQYLIVLNKFPPLTFSIITIMISIISFLGGLWIFSRARMAMMDLV
tara:strand:- start:906 stop:1715 length:810 start_codon:yes stop_codon:yes gene_type:complete